MMMMLHANNVNNADNSAYSKIITQFMILLSEFMCNKNFYIDHSYNKYT